MIDYFRKTTSVSCRHDKIDINRATGYCPDCGEYIENHWYISRCACCGIKQVAKVLNGKISADAKYCRNCGSNSFIVEELEKIDIVNIHYAVLLKQTLRPQMQSIIQTWMERCIQPQLRLTVNY